MLSSWAQLLCGMWNLSWPGLELVFSTLAGGFLSTVPPGKFLFLPFSHWCLSSYFWATLLLNLSPPCKPFFPAYTFKYIHSHMLLPSMDMWLGVVFHCYICLFLSTVVLHTFGLLYIFVVVCHRAHLYFGLSLLSFLSAYLLMHSISKLSKQKTLSTFWHIRYSVVFILFMETYLLRCSGFVVL